MENAMEIPWETVETMPMALKYHDVPTSSSCQDSHHNFKTKNRTPKFQMSLKHPGAAACPNCKTVSKTVPGHFLIFESPLGSAL